MDNAITNTIFGDLAQIEKTLSEDSVGDRARAMISYFEEVSKTSEKLLQQPIAETERRIVTQLIEGFHASQRIIRHVWETLHSASLPA